MRLLCLLIVASSLCERLGATIIWDNGPPSVPASSGNEMTQWIQAEDFVLSAPVTLTGVQFWDLQGSPGYLGSITWSIYQDTSGVPGAVLFTANTSVVTRLATGNTSTTGLAEFSNTFAISANLVTGTYWLGLHNGPLTSTARSEFYWESTPSTVANDVHFGEQYQIATNGPWMTVLQEHAFNLSGTTAAEPVLAGLTGAGLGAAVMLRRALERRGSKRKSL